MTNTSRIDQHVEVDPVTFEVLVNRLRTINDNQGIIGKRLSGSQIIYECGDYNCAIMDADGETLFLGHYNTMIGSAMDLGVKWIIENYSVEPGIRPGDVFYHNDPWIGTLHQSDCVGLAPVFVADRLVCWVGMVMHEMDVGGVVPGSFAVGFSETFAESTIITPVKLVEGGRFRPDVERAILRNSRTPGLLALDLRARLGAFNFASKAVNDVAEKYGTDVLLAVMRDVKKVVGERLAARLDELPDGQWRRVMYWDGDGTTPRAYRGELTLTKTGRDLHFDFGGTEPQAPGLINCTTVGLEGAINLGLLCTLCFDLPWATSEFRNFVSVTIDDGTIFSAIAPAAVSGATVGCAHLAVNLVQACVSEMLLGHPELSREAMAVWQPAWTGVFYNGLDHDGLPMTAIVLDGVLGGEGASPYRDGQDAGGMFLVVSMEAANVERNERVMPILQLARGLLPESGGHGRYRGGNGTAVLMTPHKAPAPLTTVLYSAYFEQTFPGLAGGSGPAIMKNRIARTTSLEECLSSGFLPVSLDEVTADTVEDMPAKAVTVLNMGDIHLMTVGGGGGYGDPLQREPAAVASDVRANRYSAATARNVYGCVFDSTGDVDVAATADARADLVRVRLNESRPVSELVSVDAVPNGRVAAHRCVACGHDLGRRSDARLGTLARSRAARDLSPLNDSPATDAYHIWEFCCPGCGLLLAAEVLKVNDPLEIVFSSSSSYDA